MISACGGGFLVMGRILGKGFIFKTFVIRYSKSLARILSKLKESTFLAKRDSFEISLVG